MVLSTVFWVITKLSNTYDSNVDLSVNLIDLPVTIVPVLEKDLELKVDLTASGFQLLTYHLFNKKVELSFENASHASGTALINLFDQRFQIEKQLFDNITVNQVIPNVLKFKYDNLKRKKVAVRPIINITFMRGYDINDGWKVEPDSLWVSGPGKLIDTIEELNTLPIKLIDVNTDIKKEIGFVKTNALLKLEVNITSISASVRKFTEKTVSSFINMKNLPDSLAIKLFPQSVAVTFSVLLDQAARIDSEDFAFSCDFATSDGGNKRSLIINLEKQPKNVSKVRWKPSQVDYLIRQ
jgi:hypothetical protein|tara:strand:- start:15 stop:902 length:888 start_codon:yes stop_codon:yes gene_type:complete